ncbi:hypothetical protein AAG906_024583 [Vitis piasezkii]
MVAHIRLTEPNNPNDLVNLDLELNFRYFEVPSDGEPQIQLLILLYQVSLPEEAYNMLDLIISTAGNLNETVISLERALGVLSKMETLEKISNKKRTKDSAFAGQENKDPPPLVVLVFEPEITSGSMDSPLVLKTLQLMVNDGFRWGVSLKGDSHVLSRLQQTESNVWHTAALIHYNVALKPFPERLYVVPPRVANGFGLLENERYVVTETKVVKPFPERLTARARVDECNSTLSEALNSSNFRFGDLIASAVQPKSAIEQISNNSSLSSSPKSTEPSNPSEKTLEVNIILSENKAEAGQINIKQTSESVRHGEDDSQSSVGKFAVVEPSDTIEVTNSVTIQDNEHNIWRALIWHAKLLDAATIFLAAIHVPTFQVYLDMGSTWPVYSSNLPMVSGHGAPRSKELIIRVFHPFDKIGCVGRGGSSIKIFRQEKRSIFQEMILLKVRTAYLIYMKILVEANRINILDPRNWETFMGLVRRQWSLTVVLETPNYSCILSSDFHSSAFEYEGCSKLASLILTVLFHYQLVPNLISAVRMKFLRKCLTKNALDQMDWVEKMIEAIATFVEFLTTLKTMHHPPDVQSIMKCIRFIDDVMTMVGLMSAQFSKPLVASKATHLVCHKFKRYLYARNAAINPGNSRDPLLDSKGRMSGIETAIFTQTDAGSSIVTYIGGDYKLHQRMPFAVDLQGTPLPDCSRSEPQVFVGSYLVQNLVVLVAEYMSGPVGDPVNWDKSMGIKMFDGDSFHSEKNKKSILVDDSFMIQPQSIVDDQSNSHFGTDISMVADIAGVTQPQRDMPEFHRKGLKFFPARESDDLYIVIDWDSAAEHVMTSWTLEMDYANNISSTEADRGPSDIETTGCINDELASNGKSIGSTNSGASKEKVSIKEARPKALGEPLVQSRSEIIMSVYKGILLVARVHLHSHFVCSCIRCYLS